MNKDKAHRWIFKYLILWIINLALIYTPSHFFFFCCFFLPPLFLFIVIKASSISVNTLDLILKVR